MTLAQFIYLAMTTSAARKIFFPASLWDIFGGAYGHSFLLGSDEYLNLGLLRPALVGDTNLHSTSRGVFGLLCMLDDNNWYRQSFLC